MKVTSSLDAKACAMISLTSPIDVNILTASMNVFWTCKFVRYSQLRVFDVKKIDSVVALLPLDRILGTFFILEELGIDIGSSEEPIKGEED